MNGLKWESVVTALFFAAMTIIAGYMSNTLRDLGTSVSELNKNMGVVVTQIQQNIKDTNEQKESLGAHAKILTDHEARIRVLEKK